MEPLRFIKPQTNLNLMISLAGRRGSISCINKSSGKVMCVEMAEPPSPSDLEKLLLKDSLLPLFLYCKDFLQ
ncbi:hypothetical protein Sjap_006689 [Stephania japonica]|uniref:Uncharacterized protein n=1 Tax=Stephania japonica TaxID=461633 RepID=A0AAP0PN20_9MAGN